MGEETKFKLTTALLKHGQVKLAEHLGISSTELSKKINGENGWKLEQIAAALDFVDVHLITEGDLVLVSKDELEALRTLARKSLESG